MMRFVLLILAACGCICGAEVNLLEHGAILSGSSFQGTVDAPRVTVETESYFTAATDGDPATGWRPMELRGPHWLKSEWHYPVRVNRVKWDALRIKSAVLQAECGRKWIRVAELKGAKGELEFPEILTDNLRLEVTEHDGLPVVFEWGIYGPAQPLVPAILPEPGADDEKISIANPEIKGKEFKPGDTVEVSFDAVMSEDLKSNYYFIVEIREKGPNAYFRFHFGDYEVTGAAVAPGEKSRVSANLKLPYYAPAGETEISVMAVRRDGKKQAAVSNNVLGKIEIKRGEQALVEEFPVSKPAWRNGVHGFQVGSQFKLPFMNRYMSTSDFKRIYDARENGVDIQYFMAYASCITRRSEWPGYFQRLDQQLTAALRVRPESYFFVSLDMRASGNWRADHPDELMINARGEVIKPGILSYGSSMYLQDCKDFIDLWLDYIKDRPYAGRIIGYHPWSCTQNDAFIGGIDDNRMVKERDKILIGDYHPDAIREFREWLRKKYGNSEAALRKAWRNETVDFSNAMPDTANMAAEDFAGGIFRDPVKSRAAIDYVEFFPSLIGNFHRRIAAHIKERTQGRALVMVHYGAIIHNLAVVQPSGARYHTTNYDLYDLLKDDNIDLYVQASPYDTRHSGDPVVLYQPIKSLTLNNRVYLQDYDARTISSGTLKYGRHRSQYETEALLRRDLTWLMLHDGGAWLADMSKAGWREWTEARKPWYSTPETTKPVRDVIGLFEQLKDVPRKSATEIAVVLSTRSPRYEDVMNASGLYRNLAILMLRQEITRLGAPYDTILTDDLTNPKLKNYKLYIFLNPFYLTTEERLAVEGLKKAGRTFLWFYAPGYVSDDGLDVKGVKSLTGINIAIKENKSELLQMTVAGKSGALTEKLDGTHFEAKTHQGVKALHPEVINPVFYVNDPKAEVLAHYPDGKAAWGVRDFGSWKSVYSAVPFLNLQALRNIAEYAGVHLYCDEDIVMMADSRMLLFDNGYGYKRTVTVKIPEAKTVRDAFSGEVISQGKKSFPLTLDTPDAKILIME